MSDPNNARVEDNIRARGPDYQRLVEHRRELERLRKREARKRQTPEQRENERERKREARLQQTHEQREREKEREGRRDRAKLKPFLAIDGEGGGIDALGRQNYFLMVASGQTLGEECILRRQGKPLSTRDCLEFILSLPADRKLVAYGEGYDATQILRGVKEPTLRQILNPRQGKNGPCYTYWGDNAIVYQQGQYLRVARVDRSGPKPAIVKGSCRTVNETLGFFQCRFVKAISDWNIGTAEERRIIAENKTRRDEFSQLTDEIIEYCKLECRLLAMLMTEFREVCKAAGISPQEWRGAGWLASALLKKHGVPKRPLTAREVAARAERKPSKNPRPAEPRRPQRDPKFEIAASAAFCGNRAEVSALGFIPGPIYKYDKRSAHPAAMPHLPCPLHTRWEHRPRASRLPDDGIYLAKVSFSHLDGPWGDLSFRRKGGLLWPLQGTTWSWSPEIGGAHRHLHAEVILRDLWVAHRECDCRPFDWVKDVYEERRRLGSDTRGYPLKIALASLYGKSAQRCGRGPYHDIVSAGLIASTTRASLLEPLGQNPRSVVMVAADAAFSRERLSLDVGEGLGQWEEKVWPDLFIAQSGVYWSPSDINLLVKSRGAPRSVIGPAAPRFHQAFTEWLDVLQRPGAMECVLRERLIPSVPVTVRVFNGCRLAIARGKPWLAGRWEDVTRHVSFDWKTKRDPMRIAVSGDGFVRTFPLKNSIFAESEGYEPADFDRLIEISGESGSAEEIDENMLLEGMPDFIPFLPRE
jgi:DNA polymerase type B, organellar and viral